MFYFCAKLVLLVSTATFIFGKAHNSFIDTISLYDLPTSELLPEYVKSLEGIANFAHDHGHHIDINFMFGLFVVHANIKFLMDRESYIARLDPSYNTLRDILLTTQDILNWFWSQIDQYQWSYSKFSSIQKQVRLTRLFFEEAMWIDEMRNFNNEEIGRVVMNTKAFEKRFSNFSDYIEKISNMKDIVPSPQLSDKCLGELMESEIKTVGRSKICSTSDDCLEMLQHGTNFGYGLTHRLFFLLFARYTRRCKIFSDTEDQSLIQTMCSIVYNEALYISDNNFRAMDLLMEQIAICTLHGYPEFLNRKMLDQVLKYQTPYGCFTDTLPQKPAKKVDQTGDQSWELNKLNMTFSILGGACNGHITSVASASISLAVRFIIETAHSH